MTRDEFRQAMVDAHSEAFTISYFDRSGWTPGSPNVLHPWSTIARKRLIELAGRVLKDCDARIGSNLPWVERKQ